MDQIVTSPRPVVTATTSSAPSVAYAGFWRRLAAAVVDSLIVSAVTQAASYVGALTQNDIVISVVAILTFVLSIAYYLYFIGNKGQTIGKMVLKIKVVRLDGVARIGYGKAFMREIVGKFVSSLIFGLGYLWMNWDKQKQTWQDKLAGTIVVKM